MTSLPTQEYVDKFQVKWSDALGENYWDLYVTDSRFVLIKTRGRGGGGHNAEGMYFAGGAEGMAIGAVADVIADVRNKRVKAYDESASLDQMLAQDSHSHAIPFNRISSLTRLKGLFGKPGTGIRITWTDENGKAKKEHFSFAVAGQDKARFDTFADVLRSLTSLQGKCTGF